MPDPQDLDAPIPFHVPETGAQEAAAAAATVEARMIQGGGPALARVEDWLAARFCVATALPTTSATHALELALMTAGIGPDHEVVVPSYTHPSTAAPVVRQGATVRFADCADDGPHMGADEVARCLTSRTRAVVAMAYGGLPLHHRAIRDLCRSEGLLFFEDAAHAFDAELDGTRCGTLGDGGTISFHQTKNVTCGEGGLFLSTDPEHGERARILREFGTDRFRLRAGHSDDYAWQSAGSSFMPSEVLMAILEVQLHKADEILRRRRGLFARYTEALRPLEQEEQVRLPETEKGVNGNGHAFYLLLRDAAHRQKTRDALAATGIATAPHFVPLDASPYGRSLAPEATSSAPRAQRVAETLLRLPLYPSLTTARQDRVIDAVLRTARS